MTGSGQVRAARELLGWTQPKLAAQAGLDPRIIAQLEAGRRPNIGKIIVIRYTLERAGVEFVIGKPGVRLNATVVRALKVTLRKG